MHISPPFLPTRAANQTEEAWLALAMTAPVSRISNTGAPEGSFPLSNHLLWHNGQHLEGQAGSDGQAYARAIADGEVIYIGAPKKANDDINDAQNLNPFGEGASWTDNGSVILRHTTHIGAYGQDTTEIVYFSLYMHLSQLASVTGSDKKKRALKVGDKVARKDAVGEAGRIYGHTRQLHFEICFDQNNLTRLIGRAPTWVDAAAIPAPTEDGRRDCVFGDIWFYLPATTPTSSTAPTSHLRSASQSTLGQALWVRMRYSGGDCTAESLSVTGQSLGEVPLRNGEYHLYDEASRRHKALPQTDRASSSLSGWYELLRFGRNLGRSLTDRDPLPANVAHWRQIHGPDGQPVWADLNAEGSFKFSDADFLPIQGWNFIDDDTQPDDQRCDSPHLKELVADPDTSNARRLEASQLASRLGDRVVARKLRRMICRFPSEWDQNSISTRYGFVRELEPFKDNPDAWTAQEAHLRALSFADLPAEYLAADWRVHPAEYIGALRKCVWLQRKDLKKIFSGIADAYLTQVLDELNKVSGKHFLNSTLRQAHFLGQIRQEAGATMAATSENLNYAPSVLRGKFSYYSAHPAEADQDGYERDARGNITRRADQEAIANKAYGGRNGNNQPGDGWLYRGRGLKQVTGRGNYRSFTNDYRGSWATGWEDFEANPAELLNFPYSLRSAVWFWTANECMNPADEGITDNHVDRVTAKVNAGELGRRQPDNTYRPAADSPALNRRRYAKEAYDHLI
ncbi:hypothetical protein [Chitiniphilus shinanonensis]|uniref:hypothetical protein n=1 Tax=Chitiniphilus shinanonensis TaxID=553088 RepID=UPI00304D57B1